MTTLPISQDPPFEYELDEYGQRILLGEGSVGPTYLGRGQPGTPFDGVFAALKQIVLLDGKGFSSKREHMILGKLNHPHIVKFLCRFRDREGVLVFATSFVDGTSLSARIQRAIDERLILTRDWTAAVLAWGIKLASALEWISARGIVHGDTSPSNIMISEQDEPVIIDFSMGRMSHLSTVAGQTETPLVDQFKTEAFASPEQFCPGKKQRCPLCQSAETACTVTVQSDLYSFGAVLWYALAGQLPFPNGSADLASLKRQGNPNPDSLPDIPSLRELLVHMLWAMPDKRPSATHVKEQLHAIAVTQFNTGETLPESPTNDHRLQDLLGEFLPLNDHVNIATRLASCALLAYLDPYDSARTDYQDDPPAYVSYEEALKFIAQLNTDDAAGPMHYRLATKGEWHLAAGFPISTNLNRSQSRVDRLFADNLPVPQPGPPADWEWTSTPAEKSPEDCRLLCYIGRNNQPLKENRHERWPKGVIRLVGEFRPLAPTPPDAGQAKSTATPPAKPIYPETPASMRRVARSS